MFVTLPQAVAQTVALACNTGRSVVAVDGADNAGRAALVEIPVGSGFLRLVSGDKCVIIPDGGTCQNDSSHAPLQPKLPCSCRTYGYGLLVPKG